MKLSECNTSFKGEIKEVLESEFDSKLMEYGIIPGAELVVLNKAPFNGPIYISIGSQKIAIRKEEASFIILK
ncbi:MAG: FeoA family protein [Flavobacteriales bacterium]